MPNSFVKDPDAILDYKFDWSSWLSTGDSISTYAMTVPAGLTQTTSTFDSDSVTVWLSGGSAGSIYSVSCLINTNASRIDERTIRMHIMER